MEVDFVVMSGIDCGLWFGLVKVMLDVSFLFCDAIRSIGII